MRLCGRLQLRNSGQPATCAQGKRGGQAQLWRMRKGDSSGRRAYCVRKIGSSYCRWWIITTISMSQNIFIVPLSTTPWPSERSFWKITNWIFFLSVSWFTLSQQNLAESKHNGLSLCSYVLCQSRKTGEVGSMRGALTWIVRSSLSHSCVFCHSLLSDRLSDAAQQTRKRVIICLFAPLFPILLRPDFTEPILI